MVWNPYTGEYEEDEDPYGATREDGGGGGGGSYSNYYPPIETTPNGGAGSSQYTDSYGYGGDGYGGDDYPDPTTDNSTGYPGGDGTYGNEQYDPSQYQFSVTHTEDGGGNGGNAGGGGTYFSPVRTGGGLVSNPNGTTPDPSSQPQTGNNTTNNSTTNNTTNNDTAIASESMTNALPPIASGSPAANPSDFTPQTIPQSKPPAPTAQPMSQSDFNIYDPSLSTPSLSPPQVQPRSALQKFGGTAGNVLKATTGLDVSGGKAFGDSLLGKIPAVDRYRRLLHDTRNRPTAKKPVNPNPYDPNDPYDYGT